MPATTKGGHQDAWRPAPPLTVNAVLHVFWSEVEGGLGVAVGEVGVGPVTQEERADLPAALGGSLVHGRELPEVSSVDLCTVLEEGRARWGEGKVGGQDGGKKEEPPQEMSRKKGQSGTNYCFTASHVHSQLLHSLTLTLTLLHAHTPFANTLPFPSLSSPSATSPPPRSGRRSKRCAGGPGRCKHGTREQSETNDSDTALTSFMEVPQSDTRRGSTRV